VSAAADMIRALAAGASLVLLTAGGAAAERPAVGTRAPLPSIRDLQGNLRSPAEFSGRRGIALVFWAGWSERSVEQLQRLDEAAAGLQARGVGVVAVSVERHGAGAPEIAAVRAQVKRLGVRVPVLVDDRFELFHAYGVIAVPSTALIDGSGRLAYFTYGYAHGQREDLFEALDRLAGIERRLPEPSRASAAAIRRLQFGRVQLSQGREAQARLTFESAAQADPAFAEPLIELAALALDEGDASRARELLDRASSLDAASPAIARERARLLFIDGDARAAIAGLDRIGTLESDPIAAAYVRLLRNDGDPSETARAMTTVRREAAAGKPSWAAQR
jgi:Flp pilus assembly protein TadD